MMSYESSITSHILGFSSMFHSQRPTNHKLTACIKLAPNSLRSCTMKIQTRDLCFYVSLFFLCCGLNFKHPYGRSLETRHLSLGLVRLAKSSDVDQLLQALLHHFANPAHHDLPTSQEKPVNFSVKML